jgi:hypothetical protein
MEDERENWIRKAVTDWAKATHHTEDIFVGLAAEDDADEEEEGSRYLVDFAVRHVGYWLVAEVWISDGQILSINDLGEGLPLDDAEWPWPAERTG